MFFAISATLSVDCFIILIGIKKIGMKKNFLAIICANISGIRILIIKPIFTLTYERNFNIMLYESTRGKVKHLASSDVIKTGIASDGGLFVPENIVKLSLGQQEQLSKLDYQHLALYLLKQYLSDYNEDELYDSIVNAYNCEKFESSEIVPLHKLNESTYVLELWHGPTCAFKDLALQLLPRLMVLAVAKTGESKEIVILTATSGDTGKAALEGFKDADGTKIIVFYPYNGVSEIQKMQMITQEGNNVFPIGIDGNFDDAQNGVKNLFGDRELVLAMDKKGFKFSSANSINWGRLVPQIVYYFSAYGNMVKNNQIKFGDKINIVVPTGNFGNILAAFYAVKMGLPVNKLICASNENNVLTEFINTGIYNAKRQFKKTISPSMDILISSNLERLLYEVTGHDSKQVVKWMNDLKNAGMYEIDTQSKREIQDLFWASYCTEDETLDTIKKVYEDYKYLVDTHTAVGINVYWKYVAISGDINTKTVIASTANPFKFNQSVAKALMGEDRIKGKSEFELLKILSDECKVPIPIGLKDLDKKEIKHFNVCPVSEMKKTVESILEIGI